MFYILSPFLSNGNYQHITLQLSAYYSIFITLVLFSYTMSCIWRLPTMNYVFLGKRIREERLRLNLTQEKLAEACGISTAYLGQIERGERCITLDKLIPLANCLGTTIDFLLSDYINPQNDTNFNILVQLFQGRSDQEKKLAIHLLKLLFSYTDGRL